jgi:DNA (cytosine-5)-methyltransferase 3A
MMANFICLGVKDKLKVVSLFDGISCGMVALERANIPVEEYHAFEIDKYAIQVSQKNYPSIIRHGSVVGADFKQFKGADLLIGGSPCQDLSIAKTNRQGLDGARSGLFWEYVRGLYKSNPKYFLFENVSSMPKEAKSIITSELGFAPIMINSALVSAQQRKRLYWTNIPGIEQPRGKGVLLKDILESGIVDREKSYCIDRSYSGGGSGERNVRNYLIGYKGRQYAFEPIALDEKSETIKSQYGKNAPSNYFRKGGYKATMIFEPIRIGNIGSNAQAHRVYSVEDKSVCINSGGGGQGAKTGLYLVPYEGGKAEFIYEVKNGYITVSDIQYPIDLLDGFYIIRKLTPIECERLQTLPDNYTDGISNTQRYKCIGNGWTVDVIAHILSYVK